MGHSADAGSATQICGDPPDRRCAAVSTLTDRRPSVGQVSWCSRFWSLVAGLRALATAHEAVAAHHGNNYLPLVEQFYKSHRSVLFTLVDAVAFIRANRDRRGEWIEETTVHVRGRRRPA